MNIEVTKLSDLDRLRDDELVAFLRGREVNTISSEGNRRRLLNLAKFYFRFFCHLFWQHKLWRMPPSKVHITLKVLVM